MSKGIRKPPMVTLACYIRIGDCIRLWYKPKYKFFYCRVYGKHLEDLSTVLITKGRLGPLTFRFPPQELVHVLGRMVPRYEH